MRLFLALNLDHAQRTRIHGDLTAVRDTAPDVRWMRPDQLHVTLRFLGEVPDKDVSEIATAARAIAARHRPFTIDLEGLGAFPHWRRPRVIWLGMREAAPVAALATTLEHASRALGFTPEERPFQGHLTIGRITRPLASGRAPVLERVARGFAGTYPVSVRTVDLMQSQLAPGGSIYSVVESFPLEAE